MWPAYCVVICNKNALDYTRMHWRRISQRSQTLSRSSNKTRNSWWSTWKLLFVAGDYCRHYVPWFNGKTCRKLGESFSERWHSQKLFNSFLFRIMIFPYCISRISSTLNAWSCHSLKLNDTLALKAQISHMHLFFHVVERNRCCC